MSRLRVKTSKRNIVPLSVDEVARFWSSFRTSRDLKAFVDKTLPVLREHLAAAQKLPQSGKNAAAMGANRK